MHYLVKLTCDNKHILEIDESLLTVPEKLLQQLQTSKYVLLEPIPLKSKTSKLEILFSYEEMKPFVHSLKEMTDLANITVSSTFKSSKAVLKFKDNAEMIINFVHKFTHNSLVYLDETEVANRRVQKSEEFYIPCVEHIFEHRVLKSFLELKGIGRAAFHYFSEFHILVQEDLLDYFNMKYGTTFSSIYQLTDFDEKQRVQIIKQLKSSAANQFMKKVNIRWHSFVGAIRQAKII